MIFYAKSVLPDGHQPTCREHLQAVSDLAGKFGAEIGQEKAAKLAGLLHDFGKYSARFQGVLKHTYEGIDHAICGAVALYYMAKSRALAYTPVIEAINGHHSGLKALFGDIDRTLADSYKEIIPVRCNDGKEAALAGIDEYSAAFSAFSSDFPDLRLTKELRKAIASHPDDTLRDMLCTRMLFSCLVDADYSISASDEHPDYLRESQIEDFSPDALLKKLDEKISAIREKSHSDPELNRLRNELFDRCGQAGELPEGLYTLTAPTGTGKTLALLNFALRHCAEHGKRRIIIVLPFLTLAEQNTDTYASIVDNILVDHSQSELGDDAREFASRWSVPFIVTTSVRFFESLFAQKPSDCRKLHSIANSVVVFDEAQSLPPHLTASTLQAVNALCSQYHCTMLFSTATQPTFDALPDVRWTPTEIMPDNGRLYAALRRTEVQWRWNERTTLETVAEEMAAEENVCAIVNKRAHARRLFELLKDRCAADEIFFITTDLCPDHRKRVVDRISARIDGGLPCRVVATQCIEAGVDLDFDVMYRALAPLDSIIQAAGRCNRNGRLPQPGRVVVFVPDEPGRLYPSDWYENAAEIVKEMLSRGPVDINDPEDIKRYYTLLLEHAKDNSALTRAVAGRDYASTAKEYKLIKNQGVRVLVPAAGKEKLYEALRDEALKTGVTTSFIRKAAPITVSTFDLNQTTAHCEKLFYAKRKNGQAIPSDYYILLPGHADCYTEDMGLQFGDVSTDDYMI